jgi:hypothetical protein
VLTLAFAQAGIAKGFMAGGYDKDLTQVLSSLYGLTPHIQTAVVAPGASGPQTGAGTGPLPPQPPPPAEHQGAPAAENGSGRSRAASRPEQPAPGTPHDSVPERPQAGRAYTAADNEPEPTDAPAPDVLTGTDLIARELGGRVISELDGS